MRGGLRFATDDPGPRQAVVGAERLGCYGAGIVPGTRRAPMAPLATARALDPAVVQVAWSVAHGRPGAVAVSVAVAV